MFTSTAAAPITVEQYLRFEGYPGLRDELINGKIILSPQPKPRHQQIAENIQNLLNQLLAGTPYVAKQNTNIKFENAHSMPAPDVFVVSRAAWKQCFENDEYVTEAPLVVVEVISRANRKKKVLEKARLYALQGIRSIWLVYPRMGAAFVFGALNGQEFQVQVDTLPLPAPVAGSISVEEIFLCPV